MAKTTPTKYLLERTYTIPLRKEFRKVANWRQTEKAVTAVREFLQKHMKSADVRLSKSLNEKIWEHGIKHPPSKVKVTAKKDEENVVRAELFGIQEVAKKKKMKHAPEKAGPSATAGAEETVQEK